MAESSLADLITERWPEIKAILLRTRIEDRAEREIEIFALVGSMQAATIIVQRAGGIYFRSK